MIKQLRKTLGIQRLSNLGFDMHQITHENTTELNKVEEEIPSTSDIAKVDDTELKKITKNAARSTKNLIEQLGAFSEDLPMHELQDLGKQLRNIQGLVKVEMAKNVEIQQRIK